MPGLPSETRLRTASALDRSGALALQGMKASGDLADAVSPFLAGRELVDRLFTVAAKAALSTSEITIFFALISSEDADVIGDHLRPHLGLHVARGLVDRLARSGVSF